MLRVADGQPGKECQLDLVRVGLLESTTHRQ
jgi:hypothetical protein